jgi:4-amino-4-deoxy-L-arabinose transferase-like glycosyltransferase
MSSRKIAALLITAGCVGLALRLICISCPPYDGHNFRQTQTLSTIEAFYHDGIDLSHPRTIYMGYPGVFVLELPLFQALCALLYHVFGAHYEVVRIVNIVWGACGAWLLYRIMRLRFGDAIAALSAIIYWLSPLNSLYQRSMLLDPMTVATGLLSFYLLCKMLDGTRPGPLQIVLFALATSITALVKALYLLPAVLLLGSYLMKTRFRLNGVILMILGIFAVSGALFIGWNIYAAQVNRLSPFTGGLSPASHLGFSILLTKEYYMMQIIRRPKVWLGAAVFLYPFGIWAATRRAEGAQRFACWFLALVPPVYLLLFANINFPHEYYQLIIVPFLSAICALGAWQAGCLLAGSKADAARISSATTVVAVILILAAPPIHCLWFKFPNLDPRIIRFENLTAGKFERGATGMLFISPEISNATVGTYPVAHQYAAGLWGYGRVVRGASDAREQFDRLAPAFARLDYLVFYGMEPPKWVPLTRFHAVFEDATNRLFIFRRLEDAGPRIKETAGLYLKGRREFSSESFFENGP